MFGQQAISPLSLVIEKDLLLSQQVFINTNGYILETDNNVFDFSGMNSIKVNFLFDFFSTVFDELLQIELGDNELILPKINVDFANKKGLFNFRFCKMCYQNEIVILWTITPYQQDLAAEKTQQQYQEQTMQAEQSKFLEHLKTT
jgi:hypothetical protein